MVRLRKLSNPTSTGLDVQTGEDRDNHTITNIGSVSKLKRIKKFGTTSANFDGSNYLAVKDKGDFDTEDFTIDVQVRMSSLSSTQTFLTNTDTGDFWEFRYHLMKGYNIELEGTVLKLSMLHTHLQAVILQTLSSFCSCSERNRIKTLSRWHTSWFNCYCC